MMVGFGENASEKVFMSCDGFWNLRCFLFFSFLYTSTVESRKVQS